MNRPLVTVVICTFNGELYLEKTLNSVLAQGYSNFEIVIVDDGSSDGTISMIERFASQYPCIRPFFRANHGLPASRNFAFTQAKGEWIAIIDQDDLCDPARLSRQMEIAECYPTAGLVFCDTHHINERDEVIGEHMSRFSPLPESFIRKGQAANLLLSLGCFSTSSSCFIRRETVQRLGVLDESLSYACDYEYLIRAGFIVDFAYSLDILAAWRIHAGQATKTCSKRHFEVRSIYRRYFWDKDVTFLTQTALLINLFKMFAKEIVYKVQRGL